MVFFTCGACGESLKKAQVEKHVSLCRGCQTLSCIDCGQDFWGDDYKNHVRCISEDQKYGGRGYEAKANKGDVKQQQWLQAIQAAPFKPGLSESLRRILKQVAMYDNVPRKQAKFENFMKNSLKIHNTSLHQQVWSILSTAAEPGNLANVEGSVGDRGISEKNNQSKHKAQRQNDGLETSQDSQLTQDLGLDTQRKRKHRDETNGTEHKRTKTGDLTTDTEEPETESTTPKGKFNWKGTIKSVLRNAPDQELPLKKLRKKVMSAFYSFVGDDLHKSEEEVLALFNRKINKNPKFRLLKDRVKLIN